MVCIVERFVRMAHDAAEKIKHKQNMNIYDMCVCSRIKAMPMFFFTSTNVRRTRIHMELLNLIRKIVKLLGFRYVDDFRYFRMIDASCVSHALGK